MSFDSCSVVATKLCKMSSVFSSVVWFLGPIFTQKIQRTLVFFLLHLIEIATQPRVAVVEWVGQVTSRGHA